jgi:hypothetical protein
MKSAKILLQMPFDDVDIPLTHEWMNKPARILARIFRKIRM